MSKLFTIIAENEMVFYDESEDLNELLSKINIPVKQIYESGKLVWSTKQKN